ENAIILAVVVDVDEVRAGRRVEIDDVKAGAGTGDQQTASVAVNAELRDLAGHLDLAHELDLFTIGDVVDQDAGLLMGDEDVIAALGIVELAVSVEIEDVVLKDREAGDGGAAVDLGALLVQQRDLPHRIRIAAQQDEAALPHQSHYDERIEVLGIEQG